MISIRGVRFVHPLFLCLGKLKRHHARDRARGVFAFTEKCAGILAPGRAHGQTAFV